MDRSAFPKDATRLQRARRASRSSATFLLVADIDRIVGFDLTTGQTAFQAPMEAGAPSLLNDIAPETEHFSRSRTDTIRGALYRLDLRTRRFATLATGIPGANGVTINSDGSSAIVVGVGNDFAGGMSSRFRSGRRATPTNGMRHSACLTAWRYFPMGGSSISNWVAADWPVDGQLIVCDCDRRHCSPAIFPAPAKRTSDISFDEAGDRLWIPLLLENRVDGIRFAMN